MGRLGLGLVLRQGLGLAIGLQLRIGIKFRRNHSWSSTFTPRRNHSLCHTVMGLPMIDCERHTTSMRSKITLFLKCLLYKVYPKSICYKRFK